MLVRKEKYYYKQLNKDIINTDFQLRKRVTFSLFGIIPIFINDSYVSGHYEF